MKRGMLFSDGSTELRRVEASELIANPRNCRIHNREQRTALRAILNEVGFADALLARELPDEKLLLIGGHLRVDEGRVVPCRC